MATDSPPTPSTAGQRTSEKVMVGTSSPTVLRRWIASELRRLRESLGLSQADAARFLRCQVPKISLIESNQRHVREADLKKLLTLYEVPEVEWDYYLTVAQRSRAKGWWEQYDERTVPQAFAYYLGLEQGAERLRVYHPALIHGLLQTREYAEAVLEHTPNGLSPEWIHRVVALRQRRQIALRRSRNPLHLSAVVDESALRRVLGGPKVMQEQLEHLVELVEQYANVTVQLMPFDRGAVSAGFSIISFPWADDSVVFTEHQDRDQGAVTNLESVEAVDAHSYCFERLSALALSPDESKEVLLQAAADYARR